MSRPASSNGVVRLASGKWRWRVMIDGVRYTGIADTEETARLARMVWTIWPPAAHIRNAEGT